MGLGIAVGCCGKYNAHSVKGLSAIGVGSDLSPPVNCPIGLGSDLLQPLHRPICLGSDLSPARTCPIGLGSDLSPENLLIPC
ncbi:hypothetical protein, partial [Limnobacter sp.]|uniref:hypothetical protein n=1 Tax=Limnobacter sp. TaxID=2003368 RepID=UPI00311FF8EF